ncbi:MAG TPA: penicillin-binding protein 1B [Gammaproteobacteria bacterium]|nr:penicillin-binding protein 1B [Gammaproteobacteria bacterium]
MAALALVGYIAYLSITVSREFEARRWDLPAQIYATPLELYSGRHLGQAELTSELRRLGYRDDTGVAGSRAPAPGHYRRLPSALELTTRKFDYAGETQASEQVKIAFSGGAISAVDGSTGHALPLLRLDPLHIGSIFPARGEDRLILEPDEIPPLLIETLKAVEDRRFDEHHGVDLRAMLRAAFVDLTHGEIRQGGSTLTQQLVRSYFLSNKRSWERKLREALMAVALELRYPKQELMTAYINEVYLAQDGIRAIHGFGLASQFYFGKPLEELDVNELALLVAEVRGPSYYNPRAHPQRALDRRNLVLDEMAQQGLIDRQTASAAEARGLGLLPADGRVASYYAAFLDLVRRQLYFEYPPDTLERKGLTVLTTLDPAVQSAAEAGLKDELAELDAERGRPNVELEGAVIVTNPQSAEVLAVVGSRKSRFDGFNRALDAKRPVGSLIKPVVYLAALQSKRYTLASLIDDSPISVPLHDGTEWRPDNFSGQAHGPVPLVRALAESFNMATVRLGLDVGIDSVARLLVKLGLKREPPHYPSLLLGAVNLTPYQIAQIYNTLANGGFRAPLRAVRAIVDSDGKTLQRYPLTIAEAADPADVYAVNQALVQVMERGTGRTARKLIPASLTAAGKTGTSNDLRDSWFAGFTNDRLIVTWVGNDANRATGLTGAAGASKVWAEVLNRIDAQPYNVPPPSGIDRAWIDYLSGLVTDPDCPNAVELPVPTGQEPPTARSCGSTKTVIVPALRSWFRRAMQ